MNSPSRYFVRVGSEVRGPYDVAQLRQLAEVDVISRATEAAVSADGSWTTLGAVAEAGAIFPARVELGFKPTEFARDNATLPAPVDVREMIAAAQIPGAVLRSPEALAQAARAAAQPAVPLPPNEVEAMVRDVQAREARFAPPPAPKPRAGMSRRLKLVVALAVAGNSVLIALPFVYDALDDGWAMLVFRGWFVIFNGGLVFLYFALPKE